MTFERQAPNEKIDLLPRRMGKWELRDNFQIASFNYRVEHGHPRWRLRDGVIGETVQHDLQGAKGSELRLAAHGGGFPPGRSFPSQTEKLFVRVLNDCDCRTSQIRPQAVIVHVYLIGRDADKVAVRKSSVTAESGGFRNLVAAAKGAIEALQSGRWKQLIRKRNIRRHRAG